MGYKHFTSFERFCIALLLPYHGITQKAIAGAIRRDPSSVSREINRNGGRKNYCSKLAQERYEFKRCLRRNVLKITNKELSDFIIDKIKQSWSPEQISSFLRMKPDCDQISFASIYRYVYSGLLEGISRVNLRKKGKKRKYRSSKQRIRDCRRINERPEIVENRERIGDFEMDTVLSGRNENAKACLLSIVDRKSGFLIANKLPNKKSESVLAAVKNAVKKLGSKTFKTITTDNGLEFACHKKVEKIAKARFYFAKPYCSWQRGTNENTNGLIREFFPKGSNFSSIEQNEVDRVVELINNRPRKRLEYKTPKEVFYNLQNCT